LYIGTFHSCQFFFQHLSFKCTTPVVLLLVERWVHQYCTKNSILHASFTLLIYFLIFVFCWWCDLSIIESSTTRLPLNYPPLIYMITVYVCIIWVLRLYLSMIYVVYVSVFGTFTKKMNSFTFTFFEKMNAFIRSFIYFFVYE